MPSVELSITCSGSSYRRGVPLDVCVSTKPRGGSAAGAIGTVSAFVFPYCCFGIPRITISIVWLIFQALAFLIGLLTGTVVDSEKCNRGVVVLATQRARCHSGAKLLSLPNLSGWSAKPNGVLGGSIIQGRDYCSFPKAFQPSTYSVSPLCNHR